MSTYYLQISFSVFQICDFRVIVIAVVRADFTDKLNIRVEYKGKVFSFKFIEEKIAEWT